MQCFEQTRVRRAQTRTNKPLAVCMRTGAGCAWFKHFSDSWFIFIGTGQVSQNRSERQISMKELRELRLEDHPTLFIRGEHPLFDERPGGCQRSGSLCKWLVAKDWWEILTTQEYQVWENHGLSKEGK